MIKDIEDLETVAASRGGHIQVKTGMFNSRDVNVILELDGDESPVFSSISCSVKGVSRLDRAAQAIGVTLGWIDGAAANEELPSDWELLSARCLLCDAPVVWENRATSPVIAACPTCAPGIISDLKEGFAGQVEAVIEEASSIAADPDSGGQGIEQVVGLLRGISAVVRDETEAS